MREILREGLGLPSLEPRRPRRRGHRRETAARPVVRRQTARSDDVWRRARTHPRQRRPRVLDSCASRIGGERRRCDADRVSHDPTQGAEKNEPLKWSPGSGTDVWELFSPAPRVTSKPSSGCWRRIRPSCAPNTRTARHSISPCARITSKLRGTCSIAVPIPSAWPATASRNRQDRGYAEMEKCWRADEPHGAPGRARRRGDPRARCSRGESCWTPRPELLHAGDRRSNQPIHWAVMTRQIDMIDELLREARTSTAPSTAHAHSAHQR